MFDELHRLWPGLAHAAGVFFIAVSLALVPVVLLRRKDPSSTIAWILTLVFLPAVGAILFWLFGRDRVRWPAKRKRELDAVVRAQVSEVHEGAGAKAEAGAPPDASQSMLER